MSRSEALLNIAILLAATLPFQLLAWWVLRRTPLDGLSGPRRLWILRIRIGAASIFVITGGLLLYFLVEAIV